MPHNVVEEVQSENIALKSLLVQNRLGVTFFKDIEIKM